MPDELLIDDSGVEDVSAAGEQVEQEQVDQGVETAETGVEEEQAAAAVQEVVTEKPEQAFAKRLAAEREKIEQQYSPYKALIEGEAARYGMTPPQYLQAIREQQQKEEANKYAEQHGLSPELAKELMTTKQELQQLKQRDLARDINARNHQQKTELKDKPFFAQLEPEIDQLVQQNPGVDVNTVFNYLRGQRMDELLESAKKEAEAKVLSDLKVKAKGRVQPGSSATVQPKAQYSSLSESLAAAASEIEW